MDAEFREFVIRSLANVWTFNAIVIGQLTYSLRASGMSREEVEAMLQNIDRECDEHLEGEDDRLHAAGLLAVVRTRLSPSD